MKLDCAGALCSFFFFRQQHAKLSFALSNFNAVLVYLITIKTTFQWNLTEKGDL